MKKLIESTKQLQGDIDRCISRLVKARQYHDKIDEAGAVFDMERLLVASAQQLQCCIDKLEDCGSVVEWQTGEPKKEGYYIVTNYDGWVTIAWCHRKIDGKLFWHGVRPIVWCELGNIKPYKEKEK